MLDLDDALRPGVLRAVVQPVVRLADDEVVGYEALVRVPDGEPPEGLLHRASAAGCRGAIELACLRAAAALGEPPEGRLLFVNLGPGVLEHPGLPDVVRQLPARVVLEITEHQQLPARDRLVQQLAPLLDGGARLAVDDTGSGYASLEHVVELRPEFLKLSSRLVSGLDGDPARLALIRALAAFAREVGASVIAEGVEREGERLALLAAGVEHAQGWLLARPGEPWPEVTVRPGRTSPVVAPPAPRRRDLAEALRRSPDARTACQAWVAHAARRPGWMPSVYLHVQGRLRLQAQQGYWHVFDGMPVSAGVMGRTFSTGTTSFVTDVAREAEYVDAVPGLASEISVPLRVAGRVVGVVNVEAAVTLPRSALREIETTSRLLAERLSQVGVPHESRARLLGRHTAELTRAAGAGDLTGVRARATAAVCALSGLGSALIAGPGPDGALVVQAATGRLADALFTLDAATLQAMLDGVSAGQTGYTAGTPGGRAPGTQAALTAAGVRTVVTLPLGSGHLLVGADRATRALATEDVELLEVLAGQVAGCLQTVDALVALRHQAERDPLTGLGNRAAFRRSLEELSGEYALAYIDIDRFKEVNDRQGHAAGDRVLTAVAEVLRAQTRTGEQGLFRLGGDEFAAVLPRVCLDEAFQRAQRMRYLVGEVQPGVSVSIGVAASAPGEAVHSVLARADAALYDAKDAGRDRVCLRTTDAARSASGVPHPRGAQPTTV